jgi:hypothetical protein
VKRLKVAVVDLVAHSVTTPLLRRRLIAPGTASFMPQALAVWLSEMGCDTHYAIWTAEEDLLNLVPGDVDLAFISAFTRASFMAYALSRHLRSRGAITVLGGPHAHSFAEHARAHFDYICQTTDRALIHDLVRDAVHERRGVVRSASQGPSTLPSVAQRAPFINHCLNKGAGPLRLVPMLGSLGCPYTCSFCVDASVPWHGLSLEPLVEDLREIERRWGPDTLVGWHDPNFAVQFDATLGAIEESRTRLVHCAHMSLSLLSEPNVRRLGQTRFGLIAPGIESWFDFSDKSGRARVVGAAKVAHVAKTLNVVAQEVQHVQTNMIVGLDTDQGSLPWELSRELVRQAPGIYPTYFLATNFYNAPLSRDLHASGRTLAMPFPLLDTNSFGNVRPLHYSMAELLDALVELYGFAYSWGAIARRTRRTPGGWGKVVTLGRSLDEGRGFITFHRALRRQLDEDVEVRAFFEGQRDAPPRAFMAEVRQQLGPYAALLPDSLLSPEGFAQSFRASTVEDLKTLRPPVAGTAPLFPRTRAQGNTVRSPPVS